METRENIILKKTLNFAVEIIQFCEELEAQKKYVIARQLLKSGTSVGANVSESQNAESRADFIHKLKIAAKEIEETKYWLMLCDMTPSYPFRPELKAQIDEIGLIVYKIIHSSKANR